MIDLMCQFVHKSKKIKLLPLRPKFRQPEQAPTTFKKGASSFPPAALIPTSPPLPPIATAPSFPPIDLTCSNRQPLPPLLSTPHHSRVLGFASAFASHTRALHEKNQT